MHFGPASVVALLVACGGRPLDGPTPIAGAPTAATVAAAVPGLPAGVDPAYVRALVPLDAAGTPRRWEGGPFHHCWEQGVDSTVVDRVAVLLTSITGIPRTDAGPCNVEWAFEPSMAGTMNAYTSIGERPITRARMVFRASYALLDAKHEAGHVMGLGHSPRREDLMALDPFPNPYREDHSFSRDELAVLAWMYGR